MEKWQECMNAGSEAFSCGRYVEAEKCFLRALDVVQKKGTVTFELYQTLNDLVLLYSLQCGKEAEAKLYYERFTQVKKALKISDAPNQIQVSKEVIERVISALNRQELDRAQFDQFQGMLRELGIDVSFRPQKKRMDDKPRVVLPSRRFARYRRPPSKEDPPFGDSNT